MSERRKTIIAKLGDPSHSSLQYTLLLMLQEMRRNVDFCPKCLVPVHASMTCNCGKAVESIAAHE
jgi:hypothetical protein